MILSPFVTGSKQPEECLVLIIDLQNSTEFYKVADAEASIRTYLNHLIADLDLIMRGGYPHKAGSAKRKASNGMPAPVSVKFMGDGFLVIWKSSKLKKKALLTFIAHLMNYQQEFGEFNKRVLKEDVNKTGLPTGIRYGMTYGVLRMFKVKGHRTTTEWIGPAINMASRLQGYCKELGFLLHDIRSLTHKDLTALGFEKVMATKMRGAGGELPVYVDHMGFRGLGKETMKLFRKMR